MGPRPRIILVDDDPAVRAALAFSFEIEGFLIETFETAEQLADRKGFPEESCLVLDYRLPGMDGLDLLTRLRERNIDTPAVMITTTPTRALRDKAAAAGVAIVEKPLLCDALTGAVRTALADHRKAA